MYIVTKVWMIGRYGGIDLSNHDMHQCCHVIM